LKDGEYKTVMILENERKHKRNFFSDPQVLRYEEELAARKEVLAKLENLEEKLNRSAQSVVSPVLFQEYLSVVKEFVYAKFIEQWRKNHRERIVLLDRGDYLNYTKMASKQTEELNSTTKNKQKLIDFHLNIQDVLFNEASFFWEYHGGNSEIQFLLDAVGRLECYADLIQEVLPMTLENVDLVIQEIPRSAQPILKEILTTQDLLLLLPVEAACHKLGLSLESFMKTLVESPEKKVMYFTCLGNLQKHQ
jgi:hypothetical protein